MQTHHKESAATVLTFLGLVATVHAGIWFQLFGIPDVTVLNWPFHYFWFVVGAWLSILGIYLGYHRYVGVIEDEKQRLHERHDADEADSGGP